MKTISLTLLLLILANTLSLQQDVSNTILWPQPQSEKYTQGSKPLLTSPCGINFVIQSTPPSSYVREIVDFYLTQVFHCSKVPSNNITVTIVVSNSTIMTATQTTHDGYDITLTEGRSWSIKAKYYSGFLRGF